MPTPTIGRIVHYKLADYERTAIVEKRKSEGGGNGNVPTGDAVYPAIVVATWGGSAANLQVFLDGNDSLWATSRAEGDQPGQWSWPVPVDAGVKAGIPA